MQKILILDFGGQYNQLIARRVRELSVYSEVHPHTLSIEEIKKMAPAGIILTGGPATVYEEDAPKCSKELFELGIPVLGICYGAQLMTYLLGGKVEKAEVREYGHTEIATDGTDLLFTGVSKKTVVWMSHTIRITEVAPGFRITASSVSSNLPSSNSPLILPSTMKSTLVHLAATFASCVTSIMVAPSLFIRTISFMTSSEDERLSAPVGSSAKMIRGLFIMLRAMQARCS